MRTLFGGSVRLALVARHDERVLDEEGVPVFVLELQQFGVKIKRIQDGTDTDQGRFVQFQEGHHHFVEHGGIHGGGLAHAHTHTQR